MVDAARTRQVADPATTAGGGNYGFTNLDPTRSYIVVATDGAGSAVDTYFANPYVSSTGGSKQTVASPPTSPPRATPSPTRTSATSARLARPDRRPGVHRHQRQRVTPTRPASTRRCRASPWISTATLTATVSRTGRAGGDDLQRRRRQLSLRQPGPYNYIVIVDTADPQIPAGYFAWLPTTTRTLTSAADVLTDDFPFTPLISKSVSATSLTPPGNLTFNITVNYPGDSLLSDVHVVDPLPQGVTFTSATAGGTDGAYVPLSQGGWGRRRPASDDDLADRQSDHGGTGRQRDHQYAC